MKAENTLNTLTKHIPEATIALRSHCWRMAWWWLLNHPDLPAGYERWLAYNLAQEWVVESFHTSHPDEPHYEI